MGGTFEKPDSEIRIDLAQLPARLRPETVFVSHGPALGILDPGLRQRSHRERLFT